MGFACIGTFFLGGKKGRYHDYFDSWDTELVEDDDSLDFGKINGFREFAVCQHCYDVLLRDTRHRLNTAELLFVRTAL